MFSSIGSTQTAKYQRNHSIVVKVQTQNFFRGTTLIVSKQLTKLKRRSTKLSNSLLEEFDMDAFNADEIDNLDQVKDGIYELVRINESYSYCEYNVYDFEGWTLIPID